MMYLILLLVFSSDIKNLASDDFFEREIAHKRLKKYDFLTWKILDRDFDDLEQKKRALEIRRILILNDPPLISTFFQINPEISYHNNSVYKSSVPDWMFIPDEYRYADGTVDADWLKSQTQYWYLKALDFGMPYYVAKFTINVAKARENSLKK